MFATLLGGLPRPPLPDAAPSGDLVAAAVRAQEAAGLELLIDGGLWGNDELGTVVERWHATAALTDRTVKAAVLGPWSATRLPRDPAVESDALEHDLAMAADATNAVLRELAAAGCPLVEVHEPAVTSLGQDPLIRGRFVEAQRRVLDGLDGLHVSLAITGGSAEEAGIDTLLGASYSSLALDLIRGPDNWRIAAAAPSPIGIICGAMTSDAGGDEAVEILLYALNYAASTASRGPDRVGRGDCRQPCGRGVGGRGTPDATTRRSRARGGRERGRTRRCSRPPGDQHPGRCPRQGRRPAREGSLDRELMTEAGDRGAILRPQSSEKGA